jgi:hypothetical protein
VLERQVYVIEDPAGRVAAYQTLGRVYGERLDRERDALAAWLNAMELDSANVETLQALHKIYETTRRGSSSSTSSSSCSRWAVRACPWPSSASCTPRSAGSRAST